jgi:large subunit ribosomal protein L31
VVWKFFLGLVSSGFLGRWGGVKVGIHPGYVDTTITCACGEVIKTRSTRSEIRVEVCSKCHPFYTGKQKFMDTAGRVERFQRKYKRQTPSNA